MDPLVVEIIGGLAVVAVTSLVSFAVVRVFRTESPLPRIPGAAPQYAYQYLNGTWHEYHITRDRYLHPNGPYWLKDVWTLQVKKGRHISGMLEIPRPGEVAKYKLLGEIRQGRMIITGASVQDPSDFFTAVFPNLIGKGQHPIVGTITAFDWNGELYTGPMVLSGSEMSLDELTKVIATAKATDFFAEREIDWVCTSIDSAPSPNTE
jgi:hypothetical protein